MEMAQLIKEWVLLLKVQGNIHMDHTLEEEPKLFALGEGNSKEEAIIHKLIHSEAQQIPDRLEVGLSYEHLLFPLIKDSFKEA